MVVKYLEIILDISPQRSSKLFSNICIFVTDVVVSINFTFVKKLIDNFLTTFEFTHSSKLVVTRTHERENINKNGENEINATMILTKITFIDKKIERK